MPNSHTEGLFDVLLAMLQSGRNSRTFHRILKQKELEKYKKDSVRSSLYKLKNKGYVTSSPEGWSVTKEGQKYIKNKETFSYIPSPFSKNDTQGVVISFDIPEPDRKLRNWLRNQIKIFGYVMLQQSLWIGPGPLPAKFLRRLENLGIRKNVKTFKIARKS